jgi:antitoxin (DNA-binding transcriptional repressor) of toxin-antitoxin stability system
MNVSAEYAEANMDKVLAAVDCGETVQIERVDKPAIKLTLVSSERVREVAVRPRSEIFGAMKGKIFLNDDWDSPATSAEIADLFENSVIFPEEK